MNINENNVVIKILEKEDNFDDLLKLSHDFSMNMKVMENFLK